MSRKLMIGAHRGASLAAVENTLDAFEQALAAGADVIETDVRVTRDGELVLFHDATLDRLAGRPERIDSLTWAELRDVPLGPTPHQAIQAAQARVCRPADLFASVRGRAQVLLDLKPPVTYGQQLMAAIQAAGVARQIIVGIRSPDELTTVQRDLPGLPVLGFGSTLEMEWAMVEAGMDLIRLRSIWIDDVSIAQARSYGRPIWVIGGGSGTGVPTGHATIEELLAYRRHGLDGALVNDLEVANRANALPIA